MYIYAHIVIFHLTFQRLPYCWLLNCASLKLRSAVMWSIGHILLRHVFGLIGKMFSFSECIVCWNKIRLAFKLYKLLFASEVTLLITTVPCPADFKWLSGFLATPASSPPPTTENWPWHHVVMSFATSAMEKVIRVLIATEVLPYKVQRRIFSDDTLVGLNWGKGGKSIDPTATSAGL